MPVTFVDIGEQRVKNIERPIRVYRINIDATARAVTPERRLTSVWRRTWTIAASIFVVGALVTIALPMVFRTSEPRTSAPPMSIAVLPLRVSEEGSESPGLPQRLSEEVITALARGKRNALVAPYAHVAIYNTNDDPRNIGRTLNVRYVGAGDIRLISKNRSTLTTRLYDAATGAQLSTDATEVTETSATARDDMLVARAVGRRDGPSNQPCRFYRSARCRGMARTRGHLRLAGTLVRGGGCVGRGATTRSDQFGLCRTTHVFSALDGPFDRSGFSCGSSA